MEIQYLHEFAVIAELGSFSKAAEVLCIAQSSLSKHLISLERELDLPLLNRTSRSVTLTAAGAEVLPLARQMTQLHHQITDIAAAQNAQEKVTVQIASIPVMAQYAITGALAQFQARHPGIDLQITECEQHELPELFARDACELAFARREADMDFSLEYKTYCADRLLAVLPADHSLAGAESVTLQQLRDEPFLLLDRQTAVYTLCRNLFTKAGFSPRIAYTGHRPENIVDLVAQGMGVALLMERHTALMGGSGVARVPLAPTVRSDICLVRHKRRHLSPAARTFWNELTPPQNFL
jgi:DNA-binding transcriptional LysR family regulator